MHAKDYIKNVNLLGKYLNILYPAKPMLNKKFRITTINKYRKNNIEYVEVADINNLHNIDRILWVNIEKGSIQKNIKEKIFKNEIDYIEKIYVLKKNQDKANKEKNYIFKVENIFEVPFSTLLNLSYKYMNWVVEHDNDWNPELIAESMFSLNIINNIIKNNNVSKFNLQFSYLGYQELFYIPNDTKIDSNKYENSYFALSLNDIIYKTINIANKQYNNFYIGKCENPACNNIIISNTTSRKKCQIPSLSEDYNYYTCEQLSRRQDKINKKLDKKLKQETGISYTELVKTVPSRYRLNPANKRLIEEGKFFDIIKWANNQYSNHPDKYIIMHGLLLYINENLDNKKRNH